MGPAPVANTPYLTRRRGRHRSGDRFYVRVPVPRDLQCTLGKNPIMRALKTGDADEAKKRMHGSLAEIFAEFDRARLGGITSEDIEHEAKRYLHEYLERIEKQPGTVFDEIEDSEGHYRGLGGEAVLVELCADAEQEDWSCNVVREAAAIARRYGVTTLAMRMAPPAPTTTGNTPIALSEAQETELYRALRCMSRSSFWLAPLVARCQVSRKTAT